MHAQKYEDDMQISGPDKVESAKLATEDWKQQGEAFKASSNEDTFVREATKTYYNAKRSEYGWIGQWSGPRPGGLTLRLRDSWGTEVRGW